MVEQKQKGKSDMETKVEAFEKAHENLETFARAMKACMVVTAGLALAQVSLVLAFA